MPRYKVNGRTFNIPDNEVDLFEADFPEAQLHYQTNDGRKFTIYANERKDFLSDFPDATELGWEQAIKEQAKQADPFQPEDNMEKPLFGSVSYKDNIGNPQDSLYYPSPLSEEGRADYEPISAEERSKQEYDMLMRQLDEFNAVNGDMMNAYEAYEQAAKYQVNEGGFAIDTPERRYLDENSAAYHQRKVEKDELNSRIKNNSYFNQMRMAEADAANETVDAISNLMAQNEAENTELHKKMQAMNALAMNPRGSFSGFSKTKEMQEYVDERDDLLTAKRLYENTAQVYAAPINDGEDIFKKFGKGFGQRVDDADFWSLGIVGIADDMNARAAFQKIQDKFGSVKEFANLTDAEIDALLTPSEQLLISAVMDNNAAMYARKDNTAGAYEAGAGAADSLMFMAQFLLTGGVGDAATVGTAAHKRLVSWLGRKVGSMSNGLMKDVARGAVKLGVGTAESIGKALVMTPLMPHTYANIADKMMSFDDNGELMDVTDAILTGAADALIETWSESTGDFVNKILGVPGGITKGIAKKALKNVDFSDWGKVMNAPMMKILKKGGFNGFLGEMGEEFIGNAVRSISGLEPDAFKEFTKLENLLVTAGSFAPMTVLGLGASSAQYGLAKRKLNNAQKAFESMLRDAGHTEDQAKYIVDELLGSTDAHLTPERLVANFSPLLRELAFNDRYANNRTQTMQAAVDFMWQIARYRTFDGVYHRQEEQQRNDMLAEIQEGTGREFWTTRLSENAGLDGTAYETDEVRAVEFNDGRVAYVLGGDGVNNTVVYNDGQTGFLSEEQLNEGKANGSIVSDATMGLNDYLTQQVARVRMTEEEQRMFDERKTNIVQVRAQFPLGATVELGTTEAPIQGVVRQQTPDGVIVESPAGISQLSWEELGHTIGVEVNPQTDAQMEEEAINNLEIADLQRRREREQRRAQRNTAAEAALEAEQMVDEAENEGLEKPIPMKADGTVDQTAFWNESPARWAQWKTEQRQDGGTYAATYIQNAIGILEGQIAESEAAFLAESDFDAKDALEQTINQQKARLAELQDLAMQYTPSVIPAETSAEATAEQTQPGTETSQPAAVMADRQKFELDAEYQRRLSLAKALAEKEMILKEYFEAISAGSMEAVVMNKQNYKQIMKDMGCDEAAIEEVTNAIKEAEEENTAVNALHVNDKIFVIAEYNYTVEQGRVSYVHERQHNITKSNPELIQRVLSLGLSRETLQKIVRTLSGTTFYDKKSDEVLADEILSSTMEIAYTFDDFSVTLSKLGIPIELINLINEINDEQRNDFTLANARRNTLPRNDRQGSSRQDVGDQGEVSGGILGEEGDGSQETGLRGTESGEPTTGGTEASEEGLQVPVAEVDEESEEDTETILNEDGFEADEQNEDVRFSVRYLPTPEQREGIIGSIIQITGRTREEAERWLESELSLVPIVLNDEEYLDYAPDSKYKAIKDNSDYPQGTVDFNNICRKRKDFTRMYTRLQRAYPNRIFTAEDLADIRTIMSEDGLVVACGLCYVEDRRQKLGEVADEFIKDLQDGFKSYGKKNATKRANAEKFRSLVGEDTYVPSIYDLITLEGSDKLHDEHKGIWDAFGAYNRARGQQTQNTFQGYAEYKREILTWSDAKVKKVNSLGGLRIFSYSDFEAHHLLDIIQIIIDCAARGVMIQGYTKVPEFARVVEKTGIKLNRSLIPLGDTGIVDGKLAYDSVEGIDINDPNFLESNDNVGNILIGINDEQIRLAMADPFIHYIIPYHARQAGNIRAKLNVGAWTNYIDTQNERKTSDGKRVEKNINIYTDVLNESITNDREFVEKYLEVCREKGYIPKFDQFLDRDAEGNYVYTPGYYKFLVDFKLFDEAGNILPQKPVVAQFDDAFNAQVLNDYAREERETVGASMNSTYDKIVETLDLGEPTVGEDVRFRESEGVIDLVEEAKKAVAKEDAKGDVSFRMTTEMKDIKEKAQADGTFMKAPNGQPTNLTEEQWLMVRTQNFIKWFGDWITAARAKRIESLKPESLVPMPSNMTSKQVYTSLREGVNKEDGTRVKFFNSVYTKIVKRGGVSEKIIATLPNIFDNSLLAYAEPDNRGGLVRPDGTIHKSHPNLAEVRNYVGKVEVDGVEYYVRFTVNMQKGNSGVHAYFATDVQLYKTNSATSLSGSNINGARVTSNGIVDAKLESFFEKTKDSSKVVDENGEPMVVFHGSNWRPLLEKEGKAVFEMNEGALGKGAYFTSAIPEASDYARDALDNWDLTEEEIEDGGYITEAFLNVRDESDILRDNAYGNDSFIVVARKPSQIKSATNNNGDFNPENEDIRFRVLDTTNAELKEKPIKLNGMYRFKLKNAFKGVKDNGGSYPYIKVQLEEVPEDYSGEKITYNGILEGFAVIRTPKGLITEGEKENEFFIDPKAIESELWDVLRATENYYEFKHGDAPYQRDWMNVEEVRFRMSNDNQAIFVSNAAKAVEGIKQEKATPEQWLKMIEKNGGLKAGEDKWMGLSDWLKASDKKTLTKQEVLDFVNEHMIIIEEQHYSNQLAYDNNSRLMDEKYPGWRDAFSFEWDDYRDAPNADILDEEEAATLYNKYNEDKVEVDEDGEIVDDTGRNKVILWGEDLGKILFGLDGNAVRPIHDTREVYTTKGLINRHEIALTVPTIESWGKSDMIHFGDAGDGRAIAWIRFGETSYKTVSEDSAAYNESIDALYAYWDYLREKYGNGWADAMTEAEKAEEKRIQDKYKIKRANLRKKVLVIDEIQSKRHQEGREKGYKSKDYWPLRTSYLENKTVYESLFDEMAAKYGEEFTDAPNEEFAKRVLDAEDYERIMKAKADFDAAADAYIPMRNAIPDAPFDKNWHELAMKRMLRYAAENGYDVIAWTKGEQQAERYGIGNAVSRIESGNAEGFSGTKKIVDIYAPNGVLSSTLYVNEDGKVVSGDYLGQSLSDIVGKEMAVKLMADGEVVIDGDNLRIGGEGMKGFYDRMLPAFMNKYGKKWGVKVEDIDLSNLENGLTMHSVPVTEEMKASVMGGQVMFRMRTEEEDAMEFTQQVINDCTSRYNEVAEVHVFPENEETAERFGYTMEELKEIGGTYVKEEDIIAIFASKDRNDSLTIENIFFHESIHKLAEFYPEFKKIGEWMWNNADVVGLQKIRNHIENGYDSEWYSEEMLTYGIAGAMSLGVADRLESVMPKELQADYRSILNEIGYEPEKESRRVESRISDSSRRGTAGAELQADESGLGKKEEARKGDLTAEERRVIGEYFPEFNKAEDVRMKVNSQGKELTEGQKEFFANSKAVDKDGNLLVLYHGTPSAGFTEFKSGWFTTSKEDAISYSGDRKGRMFDPNEKYEPETLVAGDFPLGYMTFDSEDDRAAFLAEYPEAENAVSEAEFDSMTLQADEEYDDLIARKPELQKIWSAYREYERERFVDTTISDLIANPEVYTEEDLIRAMLEYDPNTTLDSLDDLSEEERKDALVSALQNANEETEGGIMDMVVPTRVPRNGEGVKHNDLGNRTYEVYANIENPYEIDANGRGSEFESGDIYKAVERALADEQYDGAIIRNWRVGRHQQLGDVVVPKTGSQVKLTSNENPSESSDIRFRTSLELDEEFGDAWRNQQNEDGRHSTQVANTKSTYEKIGRYLEDAGMKGASILDASSGLGLGTQALREMGFKVDDVEPFPSENREAPTFSSYADIDKQYDVVISNAVLNVIPDDWRADVLHQMADAVKEGGKMIINTRPASNIAQQGVEGKTRITLDSPSEILVKRGDRIAAYQKGFTSEELAEWIKSELGEGWRVEKATKKNSGISGEGTAVVIKEGDNASFRVTGTPTDEVVANGISLTPAQTAEVAANIFAALPEESRKKITDGLNGNILGLKDAILQMPTSLATKENWNEEDRAMADVVAEEMTKMAGEMTRPFSAPEALWLLYNNLNKGNDLISQASRALVQRNLGFDEETLERQEEAKRGVSFRMVGDATANAKASMYNRGAANVWTRLKESFVDMQASVEELVSAIEKATGKEAKGFENILLALNQQSSKGLAAMESYEQRFLMPMFDEVRKIMDKAYAGYDTVVRYVILKHGLERNKKLAQRDAKAHYQEIYDEMIAKVNSMDDRQKRTYLTNAQLQDADAKAKLATLKAADTSAFTEEEKNAHKRELAKAKEEVKKAKENLERAQKINSMSEQELKDELDKVFEKIENGTDSVYKELRKNDYSGISSMFYDQLGVNRKDYSTEEEYQAALMLAKNDRFSSLEEVEAQAEGEVSSFEGRVDTKELWKRINAATKETLRQQYEANMISKDQYENLRDMFEYYVPLRGFKDNTAEDMYTYYRKPNSTGYTKPILGAEGRKTEAESPFGWIAAMAGSAIASNVKNEAKLALYYFVANRPDNGVATLSRTWFVHTPGDVDANGKKIFRPAYPPFNEDLSTDAAKQAYEDWQDQMRDLQKQGLAYEAGQRLNLGNAVVNISDANKPEHVVTVKVAGKDYTIVINGNPRAAQAINGELNIESTADDYSAIFGPVLRWMSSVNTSYNPEFWITNLMRDMAFTWMAVNTKEDPAYRKKFSKNYRKAFKVISLVAKNEKGTIGNSYIEDMYKDFVKYGGVTGYTQIKDSETWEKEIDNYLSSTDPESLKNGKMMRGMKTFFHAAHRFGESLEQVSRFAAFLTSREMGKTINEAVADAKEITVNFNRKGSGKMITLEESKYLTDKNGQPLSLPARWAAVGLSSIAPLGRRTIMFFNAAVQGLNSVYRLWKKNPKRLAGWTAAYFAIGVMNAALHAMLDDDDDYLDIPQYERRNSLMLGGNGAYLKWALPQEARAFYALGDLAVETVLGRNPHQNVVGEAMKIATEVLPVNPSEGWKAFVPSVAIPAVELMLNEDYKGAPIYNEQKWLSEEERKRTAKWSSAYQGTGTIYKGIAQGLNYVTGGDKHDAGKINLQPEKMEYIVQSAFGGTIRTADKFINTIWAMFDPEEDVTVRQTPFLNRILTLNDERFKNVHVNEVFDYYKADADHALTLEKKYRKDRDQESLNELRRSDEYQWAKVYRKYKKALDNLKEKLKVAEGTAERKELMRQQDELKRRVIKEISEL